MATKQQELRVDILLALFGDNDDKGARDLSDGEKFFISNNSGVRTEIFACLENFSHCLTLNNKVWLDKLREEIMEKLSFVDVYDKEYGKEKTEAVNEITRFVISGALVTLPPHKLDKILEIIKDKKEEEGLNNFSLGDK
jgi:hypothetical protein